MSSLTPKKWDYTLEIRKKIKSGSILLSEPFMRDDVFKRSVCLICDHSKEDGTFGFIINRNIKRKLYEFVDGFEGVELDVYYGGPVSNESLFYIHNNEADLEGAKKIADNLYWGGNFEQLRTLLLNHQMNTDNIQFIIGYSGWDPNQLRKEIIENSWVINNEYPLSKIFHQDDQLWHKIMDEMGGIYSELSKYPEHPNLN